MLETRNTVTEMKNAFDVLISRLDMAKERISKIENMLMEIPQTETQREMGWNFLKGTAYPRTMGHVPYIFCNKERKKKYSK